MQCERLIKLAKSWFIHVREETMAPARMVAFMEDHVAECPVCLKDPDIHDEIAKITEIILPESKIPKAVRMQNEQAEAEAVAEAEAEAEAEATQDGNQSETDESDVYHDDDDFSEEPDLIDNE